MKRKQKQFVPKVEQMEDRSLLSVPSPAPPVVYAVIGASKYSVRDVRSVTYVKKDAKLELDPVPTPRIIRKQTPTIDYIPPISKTRFSANTLHNEINKDQKRSKKRHHEVLERLRTLLVDKPTEEELEETCPHEENLDIFPGKQKIVNDRPVYKTCRFCGKTKI